MRKILFFSVLFFSSSLSAKIVNVPADTTTIQGGISLAENGDTVLVAEGIYLENINFQGKAITLASHYILDLDTSLISKTTIDGSQPTNPDSASVVSFVSGEDTTSVIIGFTITGGTGTRSMVTIPMPPYNLKVRSGAGINLFNSGATISHNRIIQNNLADSQVHECAGAGVGSGPPGNSSWTVIDSNLIEYNSCTKGTLTNSGGGLSISSNARVSGNTIRDNKASSTTQQAVGGGLHFEGGDTIIVKDNIFINNEAITNSTSQSGVGGGMFFMRKESAYIRVIRNLLALNHVKSSFWSGGNGAGFGLIDGDVLFVNNIIYDNYYSGSEVCHGGGLYATSSDVQIINNTFTGNKASYGGGVCSRYSEESIYFNNMDLQ